ncbi:MAG: hypothetical protein HY866_01945 [Chloroflexi bacterium]|nr:hypothetical protein [Chloroflexota bacterium]
MKSRRSLWAGGIILLFVLLLTAAAALPGWHGVAAQIDPTSQQQTVDAIVADRFTQTAVIQQQLDLTQTVLAGPTLTAAFNATVDASFNQALTATAAAQMPPVPLPTGLWSRLVALFDWSGPDQPQVVEIVPTPTLLPVIATAALLTPTPRPDIFPTNVVAQVQLAEQVFEHGRMFWIRHSRQIWVMVNVPPDNAGGDWYCYNDTFQEGEAETDPDLVPPDGMLQPRRGFGKLWRSHPELLNGLGWATTPEFELNSAYSYIAGGYVDNANYFPGPGEHRLTTLYGESISYFESDIRGDCLGGTWRMTR